MRQNPPMVPDAGLAARKQKVLLRINIEQERLATRYE
jgi:hypothetical protein